MAGREVDSVVLFAGPVDFAFAAAVVVAVEVVAAEVAAAEVAAVEVVGVGVAAAAATYVLAASP